MSDGLAEPEAPRSGPVTGARSAPQPGGLVATVSELLGGGNRRAGRTVLVLLGGGAVLLPILLLVGLAVAGGGVAGVIGLMLGVIVDLVIGVLVLGVVSHRLTSRRQRALAATLRKLRTRTRDAAAALEAQTATLEKRQAEATAATRLNLIRTTAELGNRLQQTQNLFALVPPRAPVPPLVGFAAAPDVLLLLVHQFLTLRPSLVLECGSGSSTLFLALAAQQHDIDCRLVALEHEREYAEATRELAADHGVGHLVDVRYAPLTATPLPGAPLWYDPAALTDLHGIGLVFVDGPPGTVGPLSRYPMVPLLADRLGDPCAIVVDDQNRADERAVSERWQAELPDFQYRYLPTLRGAGLFTRGGPAS